MSDGTRRAFMKNSAAAAAGLTAIGALGGTAQAIAKPNDDAEAPDAPKGSVVAYVRDAKSGEISLMAGERNVIVRDRQLAARIARAAR